MSMMFTDTYLLYKASKGTAKEIMNPSLFFEILANKLIDFNYENKDEGMRTRAHHSAQNKKRKAYQTSELQTQTQKKKKKNPAHAL